MICVASGEQTPFICNKNKVDNIQTIQLSVNDQLCFVSQTKNTIFL